MEDYIIKLKGEKEWVSWYIKDLEFSKIKWVLLTSLEFQNFLNENYIYQGQKIGLPDLETFELVPFGLTNVTFDLPIDDAMYLISYIENNISKKTILTCLKYYESMRFPLIDYDASYLAYTDTNYFYQNLGLFKLSMQKFIELASLKPYLISSYPSDLGLICHTFETIKETLELNGIKVFLNSLELKKYLDNNNKKLTKS